MTTVITGLGVVVPTGIGAEAYWAASLGGGSAIGPISRYDARRYPLSVGGELPGFDAADLVEKRFVVQTDRFTHIAMAAADMALRDAALDPRAMAPFSMGVVTASGAGGVEFGQREIQGLWREGPGAVGPYQSIAWFYAASTGQISIRHGLRGPCGVLVTDETGGLDAIDHAARQIRRGSTAMLAGGAEAPFAPFSMACQFGHDLLSRERDPSRAFLPMTKGASGFVPAEGGALFVLEDAEAAAGRGADVRAVVAGHGTTFTGAFRPERSAEGLARAARAALAQAGRDAADVDVVFADGLGTPEADAAEAAAIHDVLGPRAATVPVALPKSGTGRAYAASAAIDAACAVLSLRDGIVPPAPNLDADDPVHGLDVVRGEPRRVRLGTALVLARGLYGGNSALLLCHPDTWRKTHGRTPAHL
ncbi:ketosynthase chain-length factor [Actinomadura graeca]|uniref:Ketosynthase chain-length factor n=1 Tax=Actinomadura graeca TaxID=2750812 RepID=A0ABX8QSR7_9ACTN|nr:beta-ketoacyl synthase N-terminal-like domain-containing protein [Actinomadura graeca]QXJ21830.1 ketosynthase chain-length factor [Actinomadura graeca]